MIRATVHFVADGVTTGWLCDLSEPPRRGDEIHLLDAAGEFVHRGRVTRVARYLFATEDYRAGAERVEVDAEPLEPDDRHWLIRYEDAGAADEVFTDEAAARARSAQIGPAWNHTLFAEVESR